MNKQVERSWGRYTVLREGQDFKVKELEFDPGKPLSLQKHFMREELWLCTEGEGIMTISELPSRAWKNVFNLTAGMFVWVGKEKWHSFVAKEPTKVMEVQVGICNEEDIIRMEQPECLKGLMYENV